jgi:hypothetical protein
VNAISLVCSSASAGTGTGWSNSPVAARSVSGSIDE